MPDPSDKLQGSQCGLKQSEGKVRDLRNSLGRSKRREAVHRDTDQAETLFFTLSRKASPYKVLNTAIT